jgi:hypothetical protein
LYELAVKSRDAGHRVSARNAFLRASNYYRTAYIFMFAVPESARRRCVREANRRVPESRRIIRTADRGSEDSLKEHNAAQLLHQTRCERRAAQDIVVYGRIRRDV